MLCLVGLCGLLPGSQFGMKNKWEFYVFGIIHGINVGPIQVRARSHPPTLSLSLTHLLTPSLNSAVTRSPPLPPQAFG